MNPRKRRRKAALLSPREGDGAAAPEGRGFYHPGGVMPLFAHEVRGGPHPEDAEGFCHPKGDTFLHT